MPFVFHCRSTDIISVASGKPELIVQHRLSYRPDPKEDWVIVHARSQPAIAYRYIAAARLDSVKALARPGQFSVQLAEYLQFDTEVPTSYEGYRFETPDHGLSRLRDHARDARILREITWETFNRIFRMGRAAPSRTAEAAGFEEERSIDYVVSDAALSETWPGREARTILTSRQSRDASNRRRCLAAYQVCAMSGERIADHTGTSTCNAAHIRPVADGGPDHIVNLMLLAPSFHTAFDKGLLAIADDFTILRSSALPDRELRTPNNPSGRLLPPHDRSLWPDPRLIRWHRQNRFKP